MEPKSDFDARPHESGPGRFSSQLFRQMNGDHQKSEFRETGSKSAATSNPFKSASENPAKINVRRDFS